MIISSVDQLVGQTPIMAFNHYHIPEIPLGSILYAKLEYLNPGGSIKDRLGYYLIESGIQSGHIQKGMMLIEPTAGNTGIGLALAAQKYNLAVTVVVPEKFSIEKQQLMKALGAKIILTPTELGMTGAIKKAKELVMEIPNSFMPSQFSNQANPETYYKSLGPEIVAEVGSDITSFVAGIGSGGTFSGTARFLWESQKNIRLVGVEPEGSILNGGLSHGHDIEGIGVELIPPFLEEIPISQFITISDSEGFYYTKKLAKEFGILVGSSSGAALAASLQEIKQLPAGSQVVTIFPDSGDRYLSNNIYEYEERK